MITKKLHYNKSLTIVMNLISEEYWINANLQQHYGLADKILIIEGAVPEFVDLELANHDGSSIDNTIKIIQNFPDPMNKITILRAGVKDNRNQLRQIALDKITTEWGMIIDCDEFYKHDSFPIIRNAIDVADEAGYLALKYNFLSFYSFDEYTMDIPMERIFKVSKNLYYKNINSGQSLCRGNDEKIWDTDKIFDIPIFCYHYNRVEVIPNQQRIIKKCKYYLERDYGYKLDLNRAENMYKDMYESQVEHKIMRACLSSHPESIQQLIKN